MNEADEFKKLALAKLNEYVEGELKYLVDNGLKLSSFSMANMLIDYLSEEEKTEIHGSMEQLMEDKVVFYCRCQGIEIPKLLL